jgi:chaperone required for assembly of F1-ATPase
MKKFYQSADVAVVQDKFAIELDGRPLQTPARRSLALASRDLAQAVAAEWQAQGENVLPLTMPLTGLINTALDRTAGERPAMSQTVLAFAAMDLLCYRAEAPQDLVDLQSKTWQPLLDWADDTFAARLTVTAGILPVAQPAAAVTALERALEPFDDLPFTALCSLAAACGSLVVSLALAHRFIDADQTFRIAELDSIYQARQWGVDAEAEARQKTLRADLAAAETILLLAG